MRLLCLFCVCVCSPKRKMSLLFSAASFASSGGGEMIRFRYVARDSYMHVFFLFFPFYFSLSVILLFFPPWPSQLLLYFDQWLLSFCLAKAIEALQPFVTLLLCFPPFSIAIGTGENVIVDMFFLIFLPLSFFLFISITCTALGWGRRVDVVAVTFFFRCILWRFIS